MSVTVSVTLSRGQVDISTVSHQYLGILVRSAEMQPYSLSDHTVALMPLEAGLLAMAAPPARCPSHAGR
jgi:hypothetical protein